MYRTHGRDPDERDCFGSTPLILAVKTGQEQIVSLLLESLLADAEAEDDNGQTPLCWAAKVGNARIVDELLEVADINHKDNSGRTPLSYAAEGVHSWVNGTKPENEKVVKLLLDDRRIKPDSADNQARTPLSYAAERGRHTTVNLLLGTGRVDPFSRDAMGRTTLSYAEINWHYDVASSLKDAIYVPEEAYTMVNLSSIVA